MRLDMIGQGFKRFLNHCPMPQVRASNAQTRQKGCPKFIRCEQPMQIAARHTAIGPDRAVVPAIYMGIDFLDMNEEGTKGFEIAREIPMLGGLPAEGPASVQGRAAG